MPSATEVTLASTARMNDIAAVSTSEAAMFCPMSVPGRNENRNIPAWIAVERRFPSAEKTLPRRPMAAGTSTSRPGNRSKVPVIEPRTAPATRLVLELRTSATRP